MSASSSTGRTFNKDKIPNEIKGRMAWDPAFRQQYQALFGSDDESDEDEEQTESESDYPTVPYVSGGIRTGEPSTRPTNSGNPKTNAPPTNNAITSRTSKVAQPNLSKSSTRGSRMHVPGKHTRKARLPRRLNLNFNKDNFAKACFRRRDEPTGEFVLPKEVHEIEPNKAKMFHYLEELGVRMESFIRPPQEREDRKLLLWGKSEAVERTIRELREWCSPSEPVRAKATQSSNFVKKIFSELGDAGKRQKDAIKRAAELHKFQQVPSEGQISDPTGTFPWVVEEVRPQDILGEGLEALDSVRMAYRCHIIFDNQRSVFKIFTKYEDSVKQTQSRLEGVVKEYVARLNRPIAKYYIQPAGFANHREDVKIASSANSSAPKIPVLTGKPLEVEARFKWFKLSGDLVAQSNRGIENALRTTIPNLIYYRGQVRMRVQFGTFALTMFRWPSTANAIPFEDFVKSVTTQGTKGTMIRDLGINKDASSLLKMVHGSCHILQPIDNQVVALADVMPSLTAYFECQESEKGNLKLEVEMNGNALGLDGCLYEKTHTFWSRLGRRDNTTPLDLFRMRLDGGPSWRLRASTENKIDPTRISPKMAEFADSVRLSKSLDTELTGKKVFQWDKNPGSLLVTSYFQKTSLSFRLVKHMNYIIQLSRYDAYGPDDQVMQTNWAATLWNSDWESELMANGNLGIGECAHWNPSLPTFFPAESGTSTPQGTDKGVLDFLNVVEEVSEFLNGLKQ